MSVTMPVSWGRGETSLKITLSPLTNSSTPNTPRPPSAVVTSCAARLASVHAFSLMGWGCQEYR